MDKGEREGTKWYDLGYEEGDRFARDEADYDELNAIYRSSGIPANWDIFRAEILNRYLGEKGFDFKAYERGFAAACLEFHSKI